MMIKMAWSEDGEVQIQLFERSTVHGLTIEEATRLEHDLKVAIKEAEEDPEFTEWWRKREPYDEAMDIRFVGPLIAVRVDAAKAVWNAAKGKR